jgi:hypothetical protein
LISSLELDAHAEADGSRLASAALRAAGFVVDAVRWDGASRAHVERMVRYLT